MKILSGSFSTALRQRPNNASRTSSGSFQPEAALVSFPSYFPCGCVMNRFRHTSRLPGMTRAGDASADGHVETLHSSRISQVVFHRPVNAQKGIEETGHPTVILGN